ncbi:hypothetical protein SELMODRAFT_228924 [Selaginella moellendorffii]|uniref:2'-5' RNA ligase family protein n=1 Tax=Selaginella moellendorffii TaxID=88036 RepID=D8SJ03_SELML|nr:uncharacterized protein LOC9654782 [Selaginella moellendorffii]EFJ15586.1 hypothetical protein SELMODRAFT_228924 [Selaginella moellendorffii]|eukprot:XP_002983244.1 uncharacterized protein LOC9654782 [Selaginella moellendorffii]
MPKSFAFALYFDAALENQILELWNVLARRKITSLLIDSGSRPHMRLSVTTADDLELPKLRTTVESFAAQEGPVAISFSAAGGFFTDETSLFLTPAPTIQLLAFHDRFHELLQVMGVESLDVYQPGNWFPHCSVAQELPRNRLADAFAVFQELKLPLTGHICDVGMVELTPFQEYCAFSLDGDMC